MKKILVALAFLFTLTACGGPESGTVYAKEYIPAHTAYRTVQDYMQQAYYDPNLKMWTTRQVWMGSHKESYVEPECYWVKFKNDEGDKGDDCVGQDRYNSINEGDHFEK